MIAATALERGLEIATRNAADYEPFGVICVKAL
jgi:predicted nucleic acid-binding protein